MTANWGNASARARVAAFILVSAAASALALSVRATLDYGGGVSGGDDPVPAIAALLHGNLHGAADHQPVIGLTSILLRLPFVALARAFGGGTLVQYRFGLFACALVVGLIGLAVGRRALDGGKSPILVAAIVCLMIVNSSTFGNRLYGHPEDLLGGALCLAAVLVATDGRVALSGVFLGLALGTKAWTVVAVVPVFIACAPRQRLRMLIVAALVAAPLVVSLPLIDPTAFQRAWSSIGNFVWPYARSWWWWLSPSHSTTVSVSGLPVTTAVHQLPFGLTRSQLFWLTPITALAIGWASHRAQRAGRRVDPIALLALVLLLRCTLDPGFVSYYVVPFLTALFAWEALARPGVPLGSILGMSIFWLSESLRTRPLLQAAACLVGSLGLVVYLIPAAFPHLRRARTAVSPRRVMAAGSE